MLGFNYRSELTYSYTKSFNEMKQILNQDGYKEVSINHQQNLITYKIDNERVIRLDNFLNLFQMKYIRITIAQLIQLCQEIILKYQKLVSNSITHNYLDFNRVLLNLHPNITSLSIMPSCFSYDIHFTGYDCPFYERSDYENYRINDQDTIKSIIKQILNYTEKYSMKKVRNDQKFINIIKRLRTSIDTSFNEFINEIRKIFMEYNNTKNEHQALNNLDQQFSHLNYKRNTSISFVQQNLEALKKIYYSNNSWHIYEIYLYQTLPIITKEFRKSNLFSLKQFPQKQIQYTQYEEELNSLDQNLIVQLIKQEFNDANTYYKLDLNLDTFKQEIIKILSQHLKLLYYLKNDINFMDVNDMNKNIKHLTFLKTLFTQQILKEYFANYLQLKNLEFIDDYL